MVGPGSDILAMARSFENVCCWKLSNFPSILSAIRMLPDDVGMTTCQYSPLALQHLLGRHVSCESRASAAPHAGGREFGDPLWGWQCCATASLDKTALESLLRDLQVQTFRK